MAVETLRPNAAGDEAALALHPAEGEANWQDVDEAVTDEDATYVHEFLDTFFRDLYKLPAHSVGSGTINFIKIYFRIDGWGNEGSYAKPSLKSDTTVTDGTQITCPASWTTYSQQWSTNPATVSDPWTWGDIDALQIGVSLCRVSGSYPRCTQVYVEVDYTAGGAPAGKKSTRRLDPKPRGRVRFYPTLKLG